jgi:hypothetical protein
MLTSVREAREARAARELLVTQDQGALSMPTQLKFNIGDNTFEMEGDFTSADVVPLVREYLRGLAPSQTQADIDALTTRLMTANETQEAAVAASTPEAFPVQRKG